MEWPGTSSSPTACCVCSSCVLGSVVGVLSQHARHLVCWCGLLRTAARTVSLEHTTCNTLLSAVLVQMLLCVWLTYPPVHLGAPVLPLPGSTTPAPVTMGTTASMPTSALTAGGPGVVAAATVAAAAACATPRRARTRRACARSSLTRASASTATPAPLPTGKWLADGLGQFTKGAGGCWRVTTRCVLPCLQANSRAGRYQQYR